MTPQVPVPRRIPPPDEPVLLLTGLFAGCTTLALSFVMLWPFAWIFPAILGAVTYPFVPMRQFAIGSFAAAFGAAIGALTEMVLIVVWP